MRVLGIDTATALSGVALVETEGPGAWLQVASLRPGRGEGLTGVIERALAEAGWAPRSLDALAVAVGPGSYTGLRIGLAVAKTLAWAWDLPLAGVSTLEALAFLGSGVGQLVLAALDAGHGELFAAVYRTDRKLSAGDARLEAALEPQAIMTDDLVEKLAAWRESLPGGSAADARLAAAAVGDGCRRFRDRLEGLGGITWAWVSEEAELARPAAVARLGGQHVAAGRRADPVSLEASYLKMTEAERRWQSTRQGRMTPSIS